MATFPKRPSIVLLGDSLFAYFDGWARLAPEAAVFNFGRGGDNTHCVLKRVPEACQTQPETILLQVGLNDLLQKVAQEVIAENHLLIWQNIARQAPLANLKICSLLPVNETKFISK
ncbi:MAG: GDSL-type esterase/lipase family protein, partial [Deltaproteobacteria bacterium]|nr:GDSL-type esterase/lipase family protein [Deltaproteobacteria bacterium]